MSTTSLPEQVKAHFQQERYQVLLDLFAGHSNDQHLQSEEMQDYLTSSYLALAQNAWQRDGQRKLAELFLAKLDTQILPESIAVKAQLLKNTLAADGYFQQAVLAKQQSQWEKANGLLAEVLALVPEHPQAQQEQSIVMAQLIRQYFAEADTARQQQRYYEEYDALNRILALDPEHQLAQQRQQRVEKLIARLEKIRQ